MTAILLDLVRRLGLNLVTLADTVSEELEANPPAHVLVADEVPHAWLFPRCAVVIHHGGAGTSSQVIRSGRPGVCVPAMKFQSVWGGKIEAYGAGVLVEQQTLFQAWEDEGANALFDAVNQALTPDVQAAAQELAERARAAPGTRLAADVMESYLGDLAQRQHREDESQAV